MAVITISRPNFLFSEEGKVLKTLGIYDGMSNLAVVSETDENGFAHRIVKQGTVYVNASGLSGIIFQDIDVTGTSATKQALASIMVAGHYINSTTCLSKVVASTDLTTFVAQGLIGHNDAQLGSVTRPYGLEA